MRQDDPQTRAYAVFFLVFGVFLVVISSLNILLPSVLTLSIAVSLVLWLLGIVLAITGFELLRRTWRTGR